MLKSVVRAIYNKLLLLLSSNPGLHNTTIAELGGGHRIVQCGNMMT